LRDSKRNGHADCSCRQRENGIPSGGQLRCNAIECEDKSCSKGNAIDDDDALDNRSPGDLWIPVNHRAQGRRIAGRTLSYEKGGGITSGTSRIVDRHADEKPEWREDGALRDYSPRASPPSPVSRPPVLRDFRARLADRFSIPRAWFILLTGIIASSAHDFFLPSVYFFAQNLLADVGAIQLRSTFPVEGVLE
jgi:hypothetical protein